MEVPDFLGGTFKLLERHGHALRAKHGPELKRHIKFDDEELSLFLNVRLPAQDNWIKVPLEFVRRIRKESTAKTAEHFRDCLSTGPTSAPSTGANRIAIGKENRLPQSSTLLKYGNPGARSGSSWGSQRGSNL